MAFDAGAVKGKLLLDISQWKQGLEKAKQGVEQLGSSVKTSLDQVKVALAGPTAATAAMGSSMRNSMNQWKNNVEEAKKSTDSLTGAILRNETAIHRLGLGLTVVGTAMNMVGLQFTKFAMAAQESDNLFEVTMGSMAASTRQWSVALSQALGINQYEIRKTTGVFNAMLESMGFEDTGAAKMSQALTQLSYDMSSFYNIDTELAFQKLRAGIVGEVEPLRQLGVAVDETVTKEWALTNGLIKQGQEMTNTQKIWARFNVIMLATKDAQGDLERTSTSLTNQVRIFGSRMTEVGTQIGAIFIPTFSAVMIQLNALMVSIQKFIEENRALATFLIVSAAAVGVLTSALGLLLLALPGLAAFAAALKVSMAAALGIATLNILLFAGAIAAVAVAVTNLDLVKTALWSFAAGVNAIFASAIEAVVNYISVMEKVPVIGQMYKGIADNLRGMAEVLRENEALALNSATSSYQKQLAAHNTLTSNIKVNVATTREEFQKMLADMSKGLNDFVASSSNAMTQWRKELGQSFDWTLNTAKMTYGAMTSSFTTLFSDAFKGQLKSAKEYFQQFMTSILDGMAQLLAQWVAMKILSTALGIGFGAAGGADAGAAGGGAAASVPAHWEGTPYVPTTGLYKLHAGEKVTPRYNAQSDGEDSGGGQTIVIHNSITNEAVAAAMKSREGKNVIVNVVDSNALNNGTVRKTLGRK